MPPSEVSSETLERENYLKRCSKAFEGDDGAYSLADRVLKPLFKEKRLNTDEAEALGKALHSTSCIVLGF